MNRDINYVEIINGKCTLHYEGGTIELQDFREELEDQYLKFVDGEKDCDLNVWKTYPDCNNSSVVYKASINVLDTEEIKSISVITNYTDMNYEDVYDGNSYKELEQVVNEHLMADCFLVSLAEFIKRKDKNLYKQALAEFISGCGKEILSKEEFDIIIANQIRDKRIAELEKELADLKNTL